MQTISLIHGIGGAIGAFVHGFCAVVSVHVALGLGIKEPRCVCMTFRSVGSHRKGSFAVSSCGCKIGKIDMQDQCHLQLMHGLLILQFRRSPSPCHHFKQRKELRHGPSHGLRCITMPLARQASDSLHSYQVFLFFRRLQQKQSYRRCSGEISCWNASNKETRRPVGITLIRSNSMTGQEQKVESGKSR